MKKMAWDISLMFKAPDKEHFAELEEAVNKLKSIAYIDGTGYAMVQFCERGILIEPDHPSCDIKLVSINKCEDIFHYESNEKEVYFSMKGLPEQFYVIRFKSEQEQKS